MHDRLLVDTHIWLRWLAVSSQPLPSAATQRVNDAEDELHGLLLTD